MRDKLFHRLCTALQIRTDRNGRLYEELRAKLGMGKLTPRQFFTQNPQIPEPKLFQAFLETMEPFAQMLEQIFALCRESSANHPEGPALKLRYDDLPATLRFDAEAFKRYRAIRHAVKWRPTVAKYHNNFVPLYPMRLAEIAAHCAEPSPEPSPEPAPPDHDFLELLARAETVGRAHLELLDDIQNQIAEAPEDGLQFEKWLSTLGVSGFYLPHSRAALERWRESMQAGLAALETIRFSPNSQRLPGDKRKETLHELRSVCSALAEDQEVKTWRDAVDRWLELPYWTKRWQLYEVWIASLFLRSLQSAGGTLHTARDQLVLRPRKSNHPLATLNLGRGFALELWTDFPLPTRARTKFKPDLLVVLGSALGRTPLHSICYKHKPSDNPTNHLKDALQYAACVPMGSQHLLLNYDDLPGAPTKSPKQPRTLRAIGDVRPDGDGLQAVEEFLSRLFGEDRSQRTSLTAPLSDSTRNDPSDKLVPSDSIPPTQTVPLSEPQRGDIP